MAKRKRMHGRILAVWEEKLGTELTADAAAGATVLHVDDVSPFNDDDEEPGGWLQVGDQVIEYTTVDDDASTITLATPLTTAVTADGDEPEVWVWNDLYDQVDTVQWAQVLPDGKRDQADAIEAVVSDLIVGLRNGDRGRPRESCVLERDGDEWEVIRVKGRPSKARNASGSVAFFQDMFTLGQDGAQDLTLTYEPIEHSEHLYWNGLYQRQVVNWVRDGRIISLLDTPVPPRAGHRVSVEYAYRPAVIQTPDVPEEVIPGVPPPDPSDPANFFIPITGNVTHMPTGAGPSFAQTNVYPAPNTPGWAPGDPGYAVVGGWYTGEGVSYYGSASAHSEHHPELPPWNPAWKLYVLMRIRDIAFTAYYTPDPAKSPYELTGEPMLLPRIHLGRAGSSDYYVITDEAEQFTWNGWDAIRVDAPDDATLKWYYDGIWRPEYRTYVRFNARRYPFPGPTTKARATRQWTITEAALLIVTEG